MQKEHFEQWSEFCNAYSKPLNEIVELNTRTCNEILSKSNAWLNNLASAKRPEEIISSQIKFVMDSSACGSEYLQDLMNLLKQSSTDFTHQSGNFVNEMAKAGKANFNSNKSSKETEK